MAKHIGVGKTGEDRACAYLIKSGYRILERNYREKWDEIDIISKYKNGTLVFIEVKTLINYGGTEDNSQLIPEDNMTGAKLFKISRACQMFVAKHPELINEKRGWRIDLLALTINDNNCTMKHYENIA